MSKKQRFEREKEIFERSFVTLVQSSQVLDHAQEAVEGDLMTLLSLISTKLPAELVKYIAGLSWPCALGQPAMIMAEAESTAQFVNRKPDCWWLKYTGQDVSITRLSLFGSSYVTDLVADQTVEANGKGIKVDSLSIAVMRDQIGVLDVNFRGIFPVHRPGLWYKRFRTDAESIYIDVDLKV
jgi:hypothetical protein